MTIAPRLADYLRRGRGGLGTRPYLFGYDCYDGGHGLLNEIITICRCNALSCHARGYYRPLNVAK